MKSSGPGLSLPEVATAPTANPASPPTTVIAVSASDFLLVLTMKK
jgi:hypothetical protein